MPKADNGKNGEAFENAICARDLSVPGVAKVLEVLDEFAPGDANSEIGNLGRHYKVANGDICINGKVIELKHITTDGSGTYLNTSMNNLTKYGCLPFKPFQERSGVLDLLEIKLGPSVRDRLSPLPVGKESEFRHANPDFCKEVAKLDRVARLEYVQYLYDYFDKHRDCLARFLKDCLSKDIAGKKPADAYVVYNTRKDQVYCFKQDEILNRNLDDFKISRDGLGLSVNQLKINIGWQNGNGICNPTIRVFLK